MTKKTAWTAFPYPDKAFDYVGASLRKHWARLHLGDREPYPAEPKLAEAWRSFHRGDFQQAVELGLELGPPGYAVANKAASIYANYLEPNRTRKLKILEEVGARAEEAVAALPRHANSHYLYAYALGRHSQGASVVEALAQGIGGKIRDALARTLELEPKHAEAHTAVGTYHAEIIDKVGSILGGLTYGASRDKALDHYRKALALHPDSAIARVEFAGGLMMMFGKSRLDEATRLTVEASKLEPKDAMERLDVELARSKLEEA
jgi:tetratricopeptide (TPR) repeat protein